MTSVDDQLALKVLTTFDRVQESVEDSSEAPQLVLVALDQAVLQVVGGGDGFDLVGDFFEGVQRLAREKETEPEGEEKSARRDEHQGGHEVAEFGDLTGDVHDVELGRGRRHIADSRWTTDERIFGQGHDELSVALVAHGHRANDLTALTLRHVHDGRVDFHV